MDRGEAKRLAHKLRATGATYQVITDALKDAGYVGKLGAAIGPGSIAGLLAPKRRRKNGKRARRSDAGKPRAASTHSKPGKLQLIRVITKLTEINPGDRLALIELCADL